MKTVLITGVASGIGAASARSFVEAGWKVYGVDRVAVIDIDGVADYVRGDVAQERFWSEEAKALLEPDEALDALVNNAALQVCKPLLETSTDEWDEVMAVNLRAAFLAIRALAPLMNTQGASIINVSSVHALATSLGIGAYAASKSGLVSLTRTAAVELAERGIRVNAVLPGAVNTSMLTQGLSRFAKTDSIDDQRAALAHKTPLQRIGRPEEIADAVLYLASASSSFVTGQTLVVDGGALALLGTE